MVGIIPPVGIGLNDLPKSGGGGAVRCPGVAPPVPPALTALLRMDGKGLSSRPPQRCVSVCHDFNVRLLGTLGELLLLSSFISNQGPSNAHHLDRQK